MKSLFQLVFLPLVWAVKREAPQEHSHQKYIDTVKAMLDLNNTLSIPDPLIGLLSDGAATTALGSASLIQASCIQASIADAAFTNAKSTNNLQGMIASLIYRALERNTDAVGLASVPCTSTMKNPEFTFTQHQDPASPGARLNNKAVVLELARQIAFIGGDPILALDSGTFPVGDQQTMQGKACNEANCIFENGLLVKDASEKDLFDYVGGCVATTTVTVSNQQSTGVAESGNVSQPTSLPMVQSTTIPTTQLVTTTTTQTPPTRTTTTTTTNQPVIPPPQPTTSQVNNNPQGGNLQTFNGAVLGIRAPAVTQSGSTFIVSGQSDPFSRLSDALSRSCDVQKNDCANAANQSGGTTSVSQCDSQLQQCKGSSGLS